MTTLSSTLLLVGLVAQLNTMGKDPKTVNDLKVKLWNAKTAVQFTKERQRFIKDLIVIVADEKEKGQIRIRAVKILGEFRANEAVPTLIAYIDQVQPDLIDAKTISSVFPCVPALIKIGKPASRAVLKELHKPMKNVRRLALAVVLAGVEGRKVGRFLLQQEIAAAKKPDERRNLQKGLKAFLAMTANEREFKDDPRRGRKPKR